MGPAEIILILIIALIVFGPGKLPEIGSALGRSIREFRKASSELTQELSKTMEVSESETKEKAGVSCPKCGATNQPGNKFCGQCGAEL